MKQEFVQTVVRRHPIDEMFQVENDWLCEDCADCLTVICDHCAERVYEEKCRRG